MQEDPYYNRHLSSMALADAESQRAARLSKDLLEIHENLSYLTNCATDGGNWRNMIDAIGFQMEEEKQSRIYYQDIVYKICNILEKYGCAQKPIVCGNKNQPSTEAQDAVERVCVVCNNR